MASLTARLEKALQFFNAQFRVAKDVPKDFGMENLQSVKRDGNAFACRVLVDHVTPALPGKREA